MSIWNKSSDDVLFGYEPALWDCYPRHVVRAFFAVDYDDSPPAWEPHYDLPPDEDEMVAKAIEAFIQVEPH